MKNLFLFIVLLVVMHNSHAQYPFEQFPAIKSKVYKTWESDSVPPVKNHYALFGEMTIPRFFNAQSVTLRVAYNEEQEKSYLLLLKGGKHIQAIEQKRISFSPMNMPETVAIADVNGDGLTDIKLTIPSNGAGIGANIRTVVFLFQGKDGKFTQVSFETMGEQERDSDGDGNFEIITRTLQPHRAHNYWLFEIYSYRNGGLVNVAEQHGYPIMVQYLNRPNNTPATIDKATLKKYSKKTPDEYEVIR